MKARCFIVIFILILTVALSPVSASDGGLQFGARIGSNMNMYSVEGSPHNFDNGYGFEVGIAAKYSFTNRLNLNSEVIFCYRVLSNYRYKSEGTYLTENDDGEWLFAGYYNIDIKGSSSEMAILVPVMIQFIPVRNVPFYVSAGMQLGFPFNTKSKYLDKFTTQDGKIHDEYYEETNFDDYRSSIDFGVVFGIGCMITPNLGVDLRFVTNLNDVYYGYNVIPSSLMYFTLGISYFL